MSLRWRPTDSVGTVGSLVYVRELCSRLLPLSRYHTRSSLWVLRACEEWCLGAYTEAPALRPDLGPSTDYSPWLAENHGTATSETV